MLPPAAADFAQRQKQKLPPSAADFCYGKSRQNHSRLTHVGATRRCPARLAWRGPVRTRASMRSNMRTFAPRHAAPLGVLLRRREKQQPAWHRSAIRHKVQTQTTGSNTVLLTCRALKAAEHRSPTGEQAPIVRGPGWPEFGAAPVGRDAQGTAQRQPFGADGFGDFCRNKSHPPKAEAFDF